MPSSGQTSNCVKLLRWRFFHLFGDPALVLRSLSLLNDACQRRNLESWPGVYGFLGEWVVTTSPTNIISLLATALAVLSLFLFSSVRLKIAVTIMRCVAA